MKKISALLLVLILMGATLAGYAAAEEYDYAKITFFFNASRVQHAPDIFPVASALEEINVEYIPINPAGSDYMAELMTLIASGDTPDIIMVTPDYAAQLAAENLIIPIEEYMNEDYIPNVINSSKDWDLLVPGMVFPDGHYYWIPRISNQFGLPQTAHWIRMDWLEKVGMDVPTTYDELTDVLLAFAQAGPELLNGDDVGVFPAMAATVWNLSDFLQAYCANGDWFMAEDGLPEVGFASPRIKECMRYIKNLMDNGALNHDIATLTFETLMEQLDAGLIGYNMGYASIADEVLMQTIYPDAVWQFIPFLENVYLGDGYTSLHDVTSFNSPSNLGYAVSSSCRDVEAAFRLMNWMANAPGASEENPVRQGSVTEEQLEGSYWYYLGERGVHWELHNGYVVQGNTNAGEVSGFAEEFPELAAQMYEQNITDTWTWASRRFDNQFDFLWQGANPAQQSFAELRTNALTGNDIPDDNPYKALENKAVISDPVYVSFMPFASLESDVLAGFIYKSILGQGDIDTLYDEMIAQWNAAGYQEARQIVKEANGW